MGIGINIKQSLSGLCMGIGILCYPAGWDHPEVRGICGNQVY